MRRDDWKASAPALEAGTCLSLIPPGTGGVRDYAEAIGASLHSPVGELERDTDPASLGGDWLLLHFSGYGFQKRGVPLWLPAKVRELRKRFRRVGIMFHELYATGPVWGSAFWLSGLQQRIARDLLRQADFWLTNRNESARWLLAQKSPAAPHEVLPVFCNVGEPAASQITGPRHDRLVVFGSSGIRSSTYGWNDGEVLRQAAKLGLEVHDIGPDMPAGPLREKMVAAGVKMHGKLPAQDVSRALLQARYGALVYPTDYVAKSSIMAAYSAHGMCPVLLCSEYAVHDGLRPNVHYAGGFEAITSNFVDPQVAGRAAFKWYESHDRQAHVDAMRRLVASAMA